MQNEGKSLDNLEVQKVIRIRDLSFQYKAQKGEKALDGLTLDIEKGQFVVIMGSSRAGKSTLANCLNGLIPNFMKGKYEGEIIVMGKNPAQEKVGTMAKDIGLVFQDFESQLFATNTRLEIVFGPENFNVPRAEMQKIMDRILKVVKLEGMEDRQPSTLSGGQKQRLAIGSVLAIQPKIVCMDEPTTDLDPMGKLGVFQIAKELHQDRDLTLIIIEHETEEALEADRIVVMDDGKIVRDGKPQDVLREVEYFGSLGLMALQVPRYFHSLGIAQAELPLNPEAGLAKFRELGLGIAEDKYAGLVRKDEEREQTYSDPIIAVKGLEHTYPNGNNVVTHCIWRLANNCQSRRFQLDEVATSWCATHDD
ncbi:Putative ABC transporter [Acididesulfobacillus acetoxydans]|uniref:ABC transporter n=1 Tax=Acididesulfobacillus acetoxydans TaxID=1561005 RepID=A0A8S0XCM7_9FIRM|nr:ATP-binding cassette domain-containing protein [Acididesulfobacillus acetoxydans]CAA7602646.1 Putative ABC transporter [Acididesulfobacillus acetoxydans]CEJ09119.1 Energy-coupling factor transporter ATP-binding protein EcfA [Acididesulfobacillus acetoxydans]